MRIGTTLLQALVYCNQLPDVPSIRPMQKNLKLIRELVDHHTHPPFLCLQPQVVPERASGDKETGSSMGQELGYHNTRQSLDSSCGGIPCTGYFGLARHKAALIIYFCQSIEILRLILSVRLILF